MSDFQKKSGFSTGATFVGTVSILLLACWAFPQFWYTRSDSNAVHRWFAESTDLPGWRYEAIPVAKSAEAVLVADRLVNGEFTQAAHPPIRVFSAKRYIEKPNEIGLFVHTPDRCWTQAGWKIEPSAPDEVPLVVHDSPIIFERRIFIAPATGQRELVYFGGLVAGRPLPYRLDHNLSVASKYQASMTENTGARARATDRRLWSRVWESFRSRKQLFGPKQFFRISTPISAGDPAQAEALLQKFLSQWLRPGDFEREKDGFFHPTLAAATATPK